MASNDLSENVLPMILTLRNQRVILDADLARVYGVTTKRLNEQVKRNHERFPDDFMFQLLQNEADTVPAMRSQFATASKRNIRHRPHAFTEHGAIMAATILNSSRAVEMSVFVVRAFIKMREQLMQRSDMEARLTQVEKTLLQHDAGLRDLYQKIRPLLLPPPDPPKKSIGFHAKESRGRYRVAKQCKGAS